MSGITTRHGDGSPLEMTEAELRGDLEDGANDAADRGGVPTLTEEDYRYLMDLFRRRDRFVGVDVGNEVVLTYDGAALKFKRHCLIEERLQIMTMYEKMFGADTVELGHVDYSYKPVKPIVNYEQGTLEMGLLTTHAPLIYGAMPNLGLYTRPDGPCPNPMELLPQGKITEARAAYEDMVTEAVRDIVFVVGAMYESGADGFNLDTVGASGDADVLASFLAMEKLIAKYPDIAIEVGMAGEFVLGMHGGLTYDGVRLAGLYPHDQVKLAEKAGAKIFGPVVNTSTDQSIPWNLARTIVYTRACSKAATIPVHANMDMGVGAAPVAGCPPMDAPSRPPRPWQSLATSTGRKWASGTPWTWPWPTLKPPEWATLGRREISPPGRGSPRAAGCARPRPTSPGD
jgi:dimethylamine--corrinoid protein Co-methyltransferase